MSHTPTPWTYRRAAKHYLIEGTHAAHLKRLATVHYVGNGTTGWTSEANAAHIVRCVNSHDQLVAALQMVDRAITGRHPSTADLDQLYKIVRGALADAEKGA